MDARTHCGLTKACESGVSYARLRDGAWYSPKVRQRWANVLEGTMDQLISPSNVLTSAFSQMNIELTKPQVFSMGHHDPLDGYLTYVFLEFLRSRFSSTLPSLSEEIAALR